MDFMVFQYPMISVQACLDGILLGILFALIAYGMALQWGVMNIINIAQGDLVILGGYIAYFMYLYGIHPAWGVIVSPIIMYFVGVGLYKLVINKVVDRDLFISILATFGISILFMQLMNFAFGADVVLYSATKYIGGHSDLVAGAACGSNEVISRLKTMRVFMGNMASPFTSWLILRSLETLKIRMEKSAENADKIAEVLKKHPKVSKVYFLGLIDKSSKEYKVYKNQYSSNGGMISFDINGGEKEAFKFLDSLKLVKLAVSLGGTESLACHPYSMTHADVSIETKNKIGMEESLVRLSIGIEDSNDLIYDINKALDSV